MHLDSPSLLAVLPIQDWLAADGKLRYPDPCAERINDPSDPSHYWRYRMHLKLEDLLGATEFNAMLKEMVKAAGR